jgi:hypothetical protein
MFQTEDGYQFLNDKIGTIRVNIDIVRRIRMRSLEPCSDVDTDSEEEVINEKAKALVEHIVQYVSQKP